MPVFSSPGSVAFSVFGFDIFYYGILMGLAIVSGLFIANRVSRYLYSYDNIIFDIAPIVLLSGVVGARLYYCILNFGYYSRHLVEILDIRGGGLSIHGALIGGGLSLWYYARKQNINLAELCDSFSVALPFSQAVARWGNFFNSEAFGRPTDLPWGVYIPQDARPVEYISSSFFHPTFLYASILDLLLFFVMLYFLHSKKLKSGAYSAIYLILYSLGRVAVESIRIDCSCFILGIPLPIIVSAFIIACAGFYLWKLYRR